MCQTSRRALLFRAQPARQRTNIAALDRGRDAPSDGGAELVAMAGAGGDDEGAPDLPRREALVCGEGIGAGDDVGDAILLDAGDRWREPAADRLPLARPGGAVGIGVAGLDLVV